MSQTVKALSVRQPYAGLIMAGIKPVENRSWTTSHTGTLAICATKRPESADVFQQMRNKCRRLGLEYPEALCSLNGVCLGTVDLLGYLWMQEGKPYTDKPDVINSVLPMKQARLWWFPPEKGWVLQNPKIITPFPVTGKLCLFSVDL